MVEQISRTRAGLATEDGFALRAVDLEADAQGIADMWKASDDQWPGTWSGGVDLTAAEIRDRLTRESALEQSIWEAPDGRIAGFCSLWQLPDEESVGLIQLLNVAPEFQGRSLARRLLVHYVGRMVEMGMRRLDLYTWPGNVKAVPLYKKCGFYWLPDQGYVRMLNFMPSILRTDLLKPFFERHDWYTTMRRTLDQDEDEERWEELKVFTYAFEADGTEIVVRVDREARAMAAVQTPNFEAAAIPADVEPPMGLPTTVRWRMSNRGKEPTDVTLVAVGSEYLKTDHHLSVRLAPGETHETEAVVAVADEIPSEARSSHEPSPGVRTILTVDGTVLELGCGMRPRPPLELATHPAALDVPPGAQVPVRVQIRNRLREPVEVSLGLVAPSGAAVEPAGALVSLESEGRAGVPVAVRAAEPGVHEVAVAAHLVAGEREADPRVPPLRVFARMPGDLLWTRTEDGLVVVNDHVIVAVARVGAQVSFQKGDGTWLGWERGHPAPPEQPSEYSDARFEVDASQEGGEVVVSATARSRKDPGIAVRKLIRVTGGPVVSIAYEVHNLARGSRMFHISHQAGVSSEGGQTALPLRTGWVRGPSETLPGRPDEAMRRPDAFDEPWAATWGPEKRQWTGVVWDPSDDEIWWQFGLARRTEQREVGPRSSVSFPPLHFVFGAPDPLGVRAAWRRIAGVVAPVGEPEPKFAPVLTADLRPRVFTGTADAEVVVTNSLARPAAGSVGISLPEGWTVEPATADIAGATWESPSRIPVTVTPPDHADAARGSLSISVAETELDVGVDVVRPGVARDVSVTSEQREGHEVWTVDNGLCRAVVAPGFGASVVSLTYEGVEQLLSSFPSVGALSWLSPWHGGISPALQGPGFSGRLWRETFETAPAEVTDEHGIVWTGVRLRCERPEAEQLKGLAVSLDYLTTGGSPALRLGLRVDNTEGVVRSLWGRWAVFVAPDGTGERTDLRGPGVLRRHSDLFAWIRGPEWASASNPQTGRTLLVCSDRLDAWLAAWGDAGNHLYLGSDDLKVSQDGSLDVTAWLVVASSPEAAEPWAALGKSAHRS